jgi:NAD(P)H-flavin reductase
MYEKHWQEKMKNNKTRSPIRAANESSVLSRVQLGVQTYLFEILTDQGLADKLNVIGSFVFLRRIHDIDSFHFPVGVVKVADNKISVIVEGVGAKSQRFLSNKDDGLMVKGPYYNGILGKPWIDNIMDRKILLVAGGIGQAPALPIIQKLLKNKNTITAIVAPGKVGNVFIEDLLDKSDALVHTVPSLRKVGFSMLRELLKENNDVIVSAGPDEQHSAIIRLMNEIGVNIPMVATNNATMCCGEGICGSCHKLIQDNKIVKMCKVQTEYKTIMQD